MTCSYRPPESLPEWVNRPYLLAKQALREGRRLSPTASDRLTQELYQALRSRQATPGQNSGPRSGCCDADVARALEIHQSDQGTLRAQIEAYLLTDLPIEEIGERVDLPARVVEIYGVCFFDVRHQAHTSTLREVVEAYGDSPSDRLYQDYYWKTVALSGSIEMLEALMSPATIQSVDEAATASAAEARFILQHQVIEAARTIDVTDPNRSRELRQIVEDMQEMQPQDAYQYLLEQIDKMLQSLKLAVGPPTPEMATPQELEFAETAVELGLEDTLRVGLGLEPRQKELLMGLRFPDGPDDHEALSMPEKFVRATPADE